MLFWAVVSAEIDRVIEFFTTRLQAEAVVRAWDKDEPDHVGALRVREDRAQDGNGELARRPSASVAGRFGPKALRGEKNPDCVGVM
jgi:hypothetical protein